MENQITNEKLMEFFVDTLQKCGTFLYQEDDDTIEYCIFEEFDIDANTFLHPDTLNKLKNANLIDEKTYSKSLELRERFLSLQNTDLWNVKSIKTSKEWKELFELADNINQHLID